MKISHREITDNSPPFIIAEVGQAHDGSLGMAHAYIDAVADIGVDAVKFQTHIASAESTIDEMFRVEFSKQDNTRYDYWKRMEFTYEQWSGLAAHAKDKNLIFLSSPFSIQAVELLDRLHVPVWKIGSGEAASKEILEAVLSTKKPLLVSTGMSSFKEIDELVDCLKSHNAAFGLFQCTSKYPVPLEQVGLNIILEYKERYQCPVGLSDHSGVLFPSLAALAQGANIIEAHVVFDKRQFGPDVQSSLTIEDLKFICKARDAFYQMKINPVDKDDLSIKLEKVRTVFGKSLAPVKDLPSGTILTPQVITLKKPGTGISSQLIDKIIGRTLIKNVSMNRLFNWEDFSE